MTQVDRWAVESLSRRTLFKRGAALGGVTLGGSLLAACGGGSSDDGKKADTTKANADGGGAGGVSAKNFYDGQTPKKGGTLRYAMPGGSPADTMDPAAGTPSAQTFYYSYALYDRLWKTTPGDYQIEPALLEEFEHNEKGDEWTLRLRDGLEFHNGKTVGPDDILASIARMLDPKLASGRAGQVEIVDLKASKKLDDRTLRIKLKKPQVTFAESMAQFVQILPEGFDPKKPVGTGPFKFKSFKPGEQAEFEAFENYYLGRPHLDGLVISNYASPVAVSNALQSGQVDMGNVAYELTEVLKRNKDVHLQSYLTYGFGPIRMRCDAGPTSDPLVRQALRYAADREAMIKGAYFGQGKVANDLYAAQDPMYASALEQHTYDPEKAKSLLKQAGHEGLSIELNATNITTGLTAACTVYAQRAKAAGINVKVNKLEVPAFFGPSYPDYSFAIDYRSTAGYLQMAGLSDGPTSTGNIFRFKDAQFTKLYNEAIVQFDDAKRKELVFEMQKIQHEKGGMILWGYNNQLKGYRKVGGIVPDIGALPPHWNELWLAA
jgi:peptide/nickel transport system substrate-binding protein